MMSHAKSCNPNKQEAKQVIKCLCFKLAWSNHGNMQYDESDEQYSVLPWAITNMLETFTNLVKVTGVKNWLVGMAHQIHQFLYPIYHCF